MMSDLAALLKPPAFSPSKQGDPEQLLQDWTKYLKSFRDFLEATGAGGQHTAGHVTCDACKKSKAMLRLIGQDEMQSLLLHTGNVLDGDTFDEAVEKVETGIVKQTNQAVARHKLMKRLDQGEKSFSSLYPALKYLYPDLLMNSDIEFVFSGTR